MTYIKGNFRKYIFKGDKGYVIGLFKVREADASLIDFINLTMTFTGYFHELNESDMYIFNGNLVNHERYGEQFQVDSYEIVLPNDKDNIVSFLSSSLFPGIGEKKALLIVEMLGPDCLSIIIENPEELAHVSGLTKKQKETIYDNLIKYQSSFEIIVSLTKLGFSTKDALTIYNRFKSDTINVVNFDPYLLIDDLSNITFKKIDSIRSNFSIDDRNELRIKAGIKYVIKELSNNLGHTYFSKDEIINYAKKALFIIEDHLIIEAINILIEEGIITIISDYYTLTDIYDMEQYIANRLFTLANTSVNTFDDNEFSHLEEHYHIKYNDIQLKAIKKSNTNNLVVITGGPGTGKTTIIKAIVKLYQNINKLSDAALINDIALLAPTGRAAKRISEQSNHPASTIHRFLKWNKDDNSFRINEDNPAIVKLVIIDEASMIDTELFYNLLLGLEINTKIIIIGDYNQLPSVGKGQILKDLITSECIDVIELKELYRTDEKSNINTLAYDITNETIDFNIFNTSDDLIFIKANNYDLKTKLKPIIEDYKNDLESFQVLAPIYKGDNGIDDLNLFIKDIVNPSLKAEILIEGVPFKEDDKVLQLVNVPDLNIYNGDIGYIKKINNDKKKNILIDYDSNEVEYQISDFNNIKLGYTISIHKAQGSEFPIVIIPMLTKYSNMLYKKLIYTAVTRASKKLILIGEEEALKKAIHNDRESNRRTLLKDFIKQCIK